MKKRYLYSLLFLIPGLLIALIISTVVVGATTGFLWIFVLGDNSWPKIVEQGLALIFPLTFLGLWIALIVVGFVVGKKLEANPVLNKRHVFVSIALTVAPLLFILMHQYRVGNIGPKPESLLCGDFCAEKGYATSGMPRRDSGDRSCICYDDNGNEIIKVPMESLLSSESQ
jgi:hypothetical protein